jgi:membrane protease subunit (stomatin/prohibitin family)
MTLSVLEWKDDSGAEMVWRHPDGGELAFGSQLVVSESQWAIFFRDGRALDTFTTGRHTLTTANLPLLTRLLGVPFGGTSPFRADVVYVARKTFTDLKWGTRDPVAFRDSELSIVRLRAHGAFAVRISEPQVFVNALVGSQGRFTTQEVEGYLREAIVARLNDVLGETLRTVLDLPRHYDEVAEALKGRVAADFAKYGLVLEDFFVNAITPPDDVQRVIDERSGMAVAGDPDAYLRFKAARALGDAAKAAGGGEAGGAAAAGLGLGAGAALGMMLPGMLQGGARGREPAATGAASALCAGCGKALPEGARFCPGCGKAV